jgi:hypothetical protein
MIRLGIYRPEQLVAATRRRPSRRKAIAVTLYPEIAGSNDPRRDQVLEDILLDFSNGRTFKRTQRHRFAEFDAVSTGKVRELAASLGRLDVHDVAASDGRTSVDFFRQLDDLPRLTFLASDGSPEVTAVEDPRSGLVAVLDGDGKHLLQAVRPPFVFNVPNPGRRQLLYPVNRVVRETVLRKQIPALLARFRAGDPDLRVTRVRLLAPDCLRLIDADERFEFTTYDVLDPASGRFDVVRAMNILNPGYFSQAETTVVLDHVHTSLRDGGLLVTGSNQDAGSDVNGAVYRRTGASFSLEWVSGSGSAVDSLISRVGGRPHPVTR